MHADRACVSWQFLAMHIVLASPNCMLVNRDTISQSTRLILTAWSMDKTSIAFGCACKTRVIEHAGNMFSSLRELVIGRTITLMPSYLHCWCILQQGYFQTPHMCAFLQAIKEPFTKAFVMRMSRNHLNLYMVCIHPTPVQSWPQRWPPVFQQVLTPFTHWWAQSSQLHLQTFLIISNMQFPPSHHSLS